MLRLGETRPQSSGASSQPFLPPPPLTQVFEVHISDPREVSVLTRMDEYRALRAANARFFGNPSQPVGHLEQEVMAGNRIYLQVRGENRLWGAEQRPEPPVLVVLCALMARQPIRKTCRPFTLAIS